MDSIILTKIIKYIYGNLQAYDIYYKTARILSRADILEVIPKIKDLSFSLSKNTDQYWNEFTPLNNSFIEIYKERGNYWINILVRARYLFEIAPDVYVVNNIDFHGLNITSIDNIYISIDAFIEKTYTRILQLEQLNAPSVRTEIATD